MNNSIIKIVVTGGPCGGKTTGLSIISMELDEKKYVVICIPEAATITINSGMKPGENGITGYEFEKTVLNLQRNNELVYEDMAKNLVNRGYKVILLCDRGICDGKAYVSSEEYERIIKDMGMSETEIRDSYDAVFHLKTVADGKEEFYTLENNVARMETPEEARKMDKKTMNAWTGHPHFRVIDNSTDFKGKMNRLMSEIYSFLGLPIPVEIERKFLVEKPDLDFIMENMDATKVEIIQTYLVSDSSKEVRIRQRGIDNSYSYYLTTKVKIDEIARYETEEKISKDKYLRLMMKADTSLRQIRKDRYCFVYENQYFELDIYPECKERAILEIEITDKSEKIKLPEFISVIKEVTDDDRYKNYNIAKGEKI